VWFKLPLVHANGLLLLVFSPLPAKRNPPSHILYDTQQTTPLS
jgi:hypothetical protein